MFKKKGSLELSVNAIVVIVLAIAMLGLGIAFTKNMFGKFTDQFTIPEPTIEPSPDDPIALYNEKMDLAGDKDSSFTINYLNADSSASVAADYYPFIDCGALPAPQTTAVATTTNFKSSALNIPVGGTAKFKVQAVNMKTFRTKSFICNVLIGKGSTSTTKPTSTNLIVSKQVTFTVK